MKRRTKDPRLALERLAEHGGVEVAKAAGGYILYVGGTHRRVRFSPTSIPISAKRCLARLVLVAQWGHRAGGWGMKRDAIRDIVRLTHITSHGLVAHQEQTIREVLTHA